MAEQLTDIDGIGPKTAEDLREQGISSPEALGEAYLRRDPAVRDAGSRVKRGSRDSLLESRDSFTDPVSGAQIDESNRFAFEKLAVRTIGETPSVDSRSNENLGSDTEFRELVDPVRRGEFYSEIGDNYGALEYGANTAGNITDDSLSTGQLIDLNEAGRSRDEELTLRKESPSTGTTTATGEVQAGGLFRALSVHQSRSGEARTVDENRKAEGTTDFDTWRSAPSRFDYPGVDSKIGLGRLFPEERTKRKVGGFGSATLPNPDRRRLEDIGERFEGLDAEQERRLFGEAGVFDFKLQRALSRE
jgi:hypothetical protein